MLAGWIADILSAADPDDAARKHEAPASWTSAPGSPSRASPGTMPARKLSSLSVVGCRQQSLVILHLSVARHSPSTVNLVN